MKEKSLKRFFVIDHWIKFLNISLFIIIFSIKSLSAMVTNFSINDEDYSKIVQSNDLTDQQQHTVSGQVTDEDGILLPGVTIAVKGTTQGTVTNADGIYYLSNIPGNATLIVSFVGMQTQEVEVNYQTVINIIMSEISIGIEEVVIIGYGTQQKESVVGAISQIDNTSLMQAGTPIISNAIAGKLSGVLTMQQSGQPGIASTEIVIRGLSSWGGSDPLVLVDGVERDFTNLNPDEINTISVLKDASATAVFGAKGANGVIIVTTKRGKLGKPQMNATVSYGLSVPSRIPDHIDSYTTMFMENVAFKNHQMWQNLWTDQELAEWREPSTRLNSIRYPNINWFDLLSKDYAPQINASMTFQGGTERVKYFSMLGYYHEGSYFDQYNEGWLDTRYKFDKFNYRTNVDFDLTNTTKLGFNLGGDVSIRNEPGSEPWGALFKGSPSRFPAYFPEWVLEEIPDPDYPDAKGIRLAASPGQREGNPYSRMYNGSFQKYLGSRLFSDILFEQKLDIITKGLSFRGKVSLSTYYNHLTLENSYSFPEYQLRWDRVGVEGENPWFRSGQSDAVYTLPPVKLGVGGLSGGFYTNLYYETSLNYSNSFGNHDVTGLALINREQKNAGTDFPYYNEALVGRITYGYSHKYLAEINIGYTGSERFAPENRYGFFPSGALGWVVSEENFFKNAFPWISKLKLRYSDGLVGSDRATDRWLYISEYYKDSNGFIQEDKAPNENARWEEAHKKDIGIELGLFNNTFTVSVDLYDEQRKYMILSPQTVTMFVANSFKELNKGKLKKHGIEIEAEYNNMLGRDFSYYVKGMIALTENRIVFRDDPPYTPEYRRSEGKPMGGVTNIFGYENTGALLTGNGYYNTIDEMHNSPAPLDVSNLFIGEFKILDFNADGVIDDGDALPLRGNYYPPVTYSFSGGFNYKNFNFSFLFNGNVGKNVLFVDQWACEFYNANERVHAAQLDYWRPDNRNAGHHNLRYDPDPGVGTFYNSIKDVYWRNASYLRLRDVYVGYSFGSKFLKRSFGISNLNVFVTGSNLLTITPLIEGDPEAREFSQGFYPIMANYRLGLNIGF